MFDLIIIGGGPAGLAAAVYAINKRLETLVISEDIGGQTAYGFSAKGYEGHETIRGGDVVEKFKRQLEYLKFAHVADRVTEVKAQGKNFAIATKSGKTYEAKAVVVATGALPKRLDVPGEKKLIGKGLSYSAISHAPLFIERTVAVVGSNRRALQAVAELALIAKEVHWVLPEKGESETALGKQLRANSKVKVHSATLKEIRGDQFVESIVVGDETIKVDGLFIEAGLNPASKIVQGLGVTDESGRIQVGIDCTTRQPGLFAAGDVTNVLIEQVLVAVGEGAKAALTAYEYLINP